MAPTVHIRRTADAVVPDAVRSAPCSLPSKAPVVGRPALFPQQLAALLECGENVLVIDCRPLVEFNASHVRGAINVICSMLLKRRILKGTVTVDKLLTGCECRPPQASAPAQTPSSVLSAALAAVSPKSRVRQKRPVVIYDDAATDACSLQANEAMMLLLQVAESDPSVSPFWLHGGFTAFSRMYPALCERSRPSICTAPPMTPMVKPEPLLKLSLPPTEVLPFLYLGTEKNSADASTLDALGISMILNVAKECPYHFDEGRFEYKKCALEDSSTEDIRRIFDDAFDYIDEARRTNRRVLVHCLGGVSRSVAIVIGYLMSRYSMTLDDAYGYVRERRPVIAPNLNFMGQLLELQEEMQRRTDEIFRVPGGEADAQAVHAPAPLAAQPPPLPQFAQPAPPPTPLQSRFTWM
eukprot:Opistho-1_new@55567